MSSNVYHFYSGRCDLGAEALKMKHYSSFQELSRNSSIRNEFSQCQYL